MRILYISAAILPSNFANSVHVMKMCQALANLGNDVTLIGTQGVLSDDIFEFYNVKKIFKIILAPNIKVKALSRIIAVIREFKNYDIIYTRWPTAAFLLGVLAKRKVIYEYHSLACSKVNRYFEKKVIQRENGIRHIFITEALKNEYTKLYVELAERDVLVLPDGADVPISKLRQIEDNRKLSCGYMGSFQPGKGLEIVLLIAKELPNTTFHIIGGKKDEVLKYQKLYPCKNIIWHGFLKQKEAMEKLNNEVDIALLPNQRNVYVGNNQDVDIGRWTSPMKLFEYMSFGKAIVASRLSVLEEVLCDKENALLVEPDNIEQWIKAIISLQQDPFLLNQIRYQAYTDLKTKYTWLKRSELSLYNI